MTAHRMSSLAALVALVLATGAWGAEGAIGDSSSGSAEPTVPEAQLPTGQLSGGASAPGELRSDAPVSGAAPSALPQFDREFVSRVLSAGLFQERAAQYLLAHRPPEDQVVMFAQGMLDDHAGLDTDLAALAKAKHLPLPRLLLQRDQQGVDALAQLQGDELVKGYVAAQTGAEKEELTYLTQATTQLADPDMRAWAANAAELLRRHAERPNPISSK